MKDKEDKKKEKKALKLYNKSVKVFETVLGTQATYGTDLHKVGKYIFGKKFRGVFSSDDSKIPRGYSICNVDASNEPGSHWLAICNGMIYDSFGRKIKKLAPTLVRYRDVDLDSEQTANEQNCGCRCLAWVYTYHMLGADYAALI
jgi:hypothetical protein